MAKTSIIPENLELAARELASAWQEKIKSVTPEAIALLDNDLSLTIVHKAAELSHAELNPKIADAASLEWELSRALPGFHLSTSQMLSVWSLAAAVITGWFVGGLLDTLLGFLGLGGEILRPLAIFASVWLIDYLASNPAAKSRLLKICGWTGLAGFAAKLAGGFLRFGQSWRALIFGGARHGFFKTIWLWLGAFFIFIFFAKKATRANQAQLQEQLTTQIAQKLFLSFQIFTLINEYASKSEVYNVTLSKCKSEKDSLADAIIGLLDSFEPEKRSFLLSALKNAGITLQNHDASSFVWNRQKDASFYEQLGFLKDGDQVMILRRPVITDGGVKKGLVQIAGSGPGDSDENYRH